MFGFLNRNTDNNNNNNNNNNKNNAKSNMVMLTEADIKRLKNNHGVVLFFMNGCGHCVDMKDDWNTAVDECRNNGIGHDKDDFILGAIESSNTDMFKRHGITTNVNGYPTILYINSEKIHKDDMNHEKYEKPRTKDEFVSWIKEKKNRKKGKNQVNTQEVGNNKNKGKQIGGGRRRTYRRKSKSKRQTKRHTRRHKRTRRHRRHMKGGGCGCGTGGIDALLGK